MLIEEAGAVLLRVLLRPGRLAALAVAALVASSPAASDRSSERAEDYRRWHAACIGSGAGGIDDQIAKFEERLAEDPADQLARAYLGSACALRARESFWPLTKVRFLRRAEALMDEAVAASPGDARVRMVNAIGSYLLPERFGRRAVALREFEHLVEAAKADDGRLTDRERQVVLYYAALAFEEDGREGVEALRQLCHMIDPESKYGRATG